MRRAKTLFLIFTILINVTFPSAVYALESDKNNVKLTPAFKADDEVVLFSKANIAAYENAVFVTETDFLNSKAVNDGITVVYGSNLNVDALNRHITGDIAINKEGNATQGFATDLTYDEITGEYICDDSPYYGMPYSNTTASETSKQTNSESENVYIAIFSKYGDRIDKTYVSVLYDKDVNAQVINDFVSAEISDTALDNYLKDEVNRLYKQPLGFSSDKARASSSTRIVDRTTSINSKIINLQRGSSVYPVMAYKRNSVYTSILIANELQNEDAYLLHSSAYITPSSAISSSEASGIYNDTYGNAIVTCAAKVFFENKYPNVDYYVGMQPAVNNSNINNVGSLSLDMGISFAGLSLSFPVFFTTGSKVACSYHFTRLEQCYFMFEGTTALYRKCVSTEPFLIESIVSFSSGYSQLYTTYGTHVKYHIDANTNQCTWSGRAIDVYYENNE